MEPIEITAVLMGMANLVLVFLVISNKVKIIGIEQRINRLRDHYDHQMRQVAKVYQDPNKTAKEISQDLDSITGNSFYKREDADNKPHLI